MHQFLAYIDPGAGSLIIQAVIAGIVAVPFFFRQQIGRLLRTVRRAESTGSTGSAGNPAPPDAASSVDRTR